MRFGFVSAFYEENLDMAKELGFDGVELVIGWKGHPLHPHTITEEEIKTLKEALENRGISALTLQYGMNYVQAEEEGVSVVDSLGKLLEIGKKVNSEVVTFNAWVPAGLTEKEQLEYLKSRLGDVVKRAFDMGMRLAIENCPHRGLNFASTPKRWEQIFNEIDSPALGLQFDPSHLVWLGVDFVKAIRDFGSKIYSFHAKDTQILHDTLGKVGIYGDGWWRYRVPGYGDISWKDVFVALSDVNYEADVIIEHEDPLLSGERFRDGLAVGLRTLKYHAYVE